MKIVAVDTKVGRIIWLNTDAIESMWEDSGSVTVRTVSGLTYPLLNTPLKQFVAWLQNPDNGQFYQIS